MRLDVNAQGLLLAQSVLASLSGAQTRKALATALNDAAFEVRRVMQDEMRTVFDRPTEYILRSPRVRMAKPDALSATVEPTYAGGKGMDPQKILNAQAWGGRRSDKRSEVALRRVGILPRGYQVVIPATPFPGSDDGRGNLRGPFLAQLISYFQAFGEQGYKANMKDKRRRQIHKGTKKTAGRRYFVAYGGLRAGGRTTQRGESDQRASSLAPGVWAASGTGGVNVRPVLMFVKTGSYSVRLDTERIASRADVHNYLERRIRFRIREAAGV